MTHSHHTSESDTRFHVARSIVSDAARLALSMLPSPGKPQGSLKGKQDYVTEADKAVEKLITTRIQSLFPHDGILGEENGAHGDGDYLWVIDPIDGTSNFARGRNRWCISLGLLHDGKPVAGIIHAPALNEIFTAHLGQGAFLNNRPISASKTHDMGEAMVEVGWSPYAAEGWFQKKMSSLLELGTMPRSLGSGALALADVACGRSDGYLEHTIFLWDVAAALVILHEAGAHVSPFLDMGGRTHPTTILATAPAISSTLAACFDVKMT